MVFPFFIYKFMYHIHMLTLIGWGCILYGIIVCSARSGSRFYMFWLICGLCILFGQNYFRYPMIYIPLIAFLSLFLIIEIRILYCFLKKLDQPVDAMIILGAQVHSYGPCRSLAYRLDAAKAYWDVHPDVLCVVSGGQGQNEPDTEASIMKQYLVEKGMDEKKILVEDQSTNTVENLTFSKKMLPNVDSVAVVTSNFHVYRSVRIARKAGYKRVEGLAARSSYLYLVTNMVREFFAIIKDKLCGNI